MLLPRGTISSLARQGVIIILIGQDTYKLTPWIVMTKLATTLNQIGQDIIGEANGDKFGYSVSISEEGKTIAVGAKYGANNNLGYARIYRLEDDGMSWGQIGKDIDGKAAYDNTEVSVSLSTDGSTISIGEPFNNDNGVTSGQVMVYRINSEGLSWERLVQGMATMQVIILGHL